MHGYCGSYRWAAGRHRRGRFGGFGFGGRHGGIGGGMNPDDMRAGRMLAQGDLRLVALALIAQAPRHGYEIIKLVEEKTADWYSPSPGIVYPTLTFLEEAGYVTVSAEGAKKLYTITEAGRAHLKDNEEAAQAMLGQLEFIARKMGRVREFFGGFAEEESADSQELEAARRELKQLLREKRGASAAEKTRIAAILKGAAAQIRGG